MKPITTVHGLDKVGLFINLEDRARAELAERLDPIAVKRGHVLMRQGDEPDALYIVVSGRFAVTRDGRRSAISEVGPDQPIGEIGFLTGAPRTATVSAMRDSLVLRLGREEFDEFASRHPGIWPALTATLAERLAKTTAAAAPPPDPRPRTIALIRAGGSQLPGELVALLTGIFGKAARTLTVAPNDAPGVLGGNGGLGSTEATRRLNALEREYDYVLFVADPELTHWSEKVISHADLVVAAGMHSADATPNPLERFASELLSADARRLVLLHKRRGRVTGTSRWLRGRDVAMHHHVALDGTADAERLFRFISGTALGLVTCGGGAFCAAHAGVYKALLEQGLSFDIMGGTSGGSALAAAFMLTGSADEIDAVLHDMFVTHKAMRRYTLPRYSILDHSNFDLQLKRIFGGFGIEDLWLPYFAVSTNLSRYTLHIHRQGSLWTAIRASASIPVLLPPVYTKDGEMLVDGCLLDNVPIRVMHDLKSGPNVVVSFEMPVLERFDVDYETLPSRGELLRWAFDPRKRGLLPAAPGLTTVLMRSLMANRHDFSRNLGAEDLLLVPPLPADMGLLDWTRHTELVRGSYAWSVDELARARTAGHAVFS